MTATAPAPAAETAAATTAKASHLVQSGVNLLLGLLKDTNEITSLLRVCRDCQYTPPYHRAGEGGYGDKGGRRGRGG